MSLPQKNEPPGVWAVAMLCAGVMLNLVLLDSLSWDYDLIAQPGWLMAALGVGAGFLCFGVVGGPARLSRGFGGSFEQAVERSVGSRAAWMFQNVLVPVWALGWFAVLSWSASEAIGRAMSYSPSLRWESGALRTVGIAAIWFCMIMPAGRVPLAAVARWSVWVAKVSFGAVLGLMLSTAGLLPRAWERLADFEIEGRRVWGLESHLLLWAVPPLLLCVPLIASVAKSRRALATVLGAGIVGPFSFATVAAMLTTAGATMLGVRHMKYPSYLGYAISRPEKLGWVKVLVLTFTLLTASRLVVNLCADRLPGARSWEKSVGVTAALLGMSFALREVEWGHRVWQVGAMPFAPLAGVLCARAWSDTEVAPRWGCLAWAAGCLVTLIPVWFAPYPRSTQVLPAWVIFGWVVSLTVTWLGRGLLREPGEVERVVRSE